MKRTKADKKVNRIVRQINKQLRDDVFGDRFSVVQLKRTAPYDDCRSYFYYIYQLRDAAQPDRNCEAHYSQDEITMTNGLCILKNLNDFIVESNFWDIFDTKEELKHTGYCPKCNEYRDYTIRKGKVTTTIDGDTFSIHGDVGYCKKCGSKVICKEVEDNNKKRFIAYHKLRTTVDE